MTKLLFKVTGTKNVFINSFAALFTSGIAFLIVSFVVLALNNGIKTF